MAGFSVAQKLDKLGMRGSNTGELVFEDVRGAVRERAATRRARRRGADERASTTSARCWPAARSASWQACLDVVVPYVHERKQFGQPIGEFQLDAGQARRHVCRR